MSADLLPFPKPDASEAMNAPIRQARDEPGDERLAAWAELQAEALAGRAQREYFARLGAAWAALLRALWGL